MKILIVKLSSLGDILHTLPVVHDIKIALPEAQIDWVVEASFSDVVKRCQGVNKVITCELRKWRKTPFAGATRIAWRAFKADLQQEQYDAVIDLQGLTKSALVSKLARLSTSGKRYAMANRTDGSSYEALTRWVADVAIKLKPHCHAVHRARQLCAQALKYQIATTDQEIVSFISVAGVLIDSIAIKNEANLLNKKTVVFAHGSSRQDKLWPIENWVDIGKRLNNLGLSVAIVHGNSEEEKRSQVIDQQLREARVMPRLGLDALLDVLGSSAGVIGVDSGLSHMAVALGLPHVQIYNFDTAWRTGPSLSSSPRQVSVYAKPSPSVDDVWLAWQNANTNTNVTINANENISASKV